MPTTSNFGWTTPADTDLVKDGAAAIRTLGNGIDTSFLDLKGGTTGQVLSKASNTDLDFTWTNVDPLTILDAKGDLISATAADTPARLASSGVNGDVLTVDTSTATGLKWAAPASGTLTWTRRLVETNPLNAIAFSGSVYVAVGDGGTLYSSTNGTTWTSRTSGFGSNGIRTVHWASGLSLFIAGGNNGTITTSPDGTTWTARTSNMGTNAINHIHSSGTTVVAVGQGGGTTNTGGLTYSSDGLTWTRKSQSLTVGSTYNAVTYNGTNWIIVASLSTNDYLYASTPSGTWTAAASGIGASLYGIVYDGTRMIVNDASNYYYYTGTTLSSANLIYDVQTPVDYANFMMGYQSFYNGRIYTAGIFTYDFSTSVSGAASGGASFTGQTPGVMRISDYLNRGYFVGAIGRIMWSRYALYTSF